MNFIKKYAWAFWLGGSVGVAGHNLAALAYWYIIIPVTALIAWKDW